MTEPDIITSRRHSLVRELADIRDDRDSPLMFLEGPHLVHEVLNSRIAIEILMWTSSAISDPVWELAQVKAKRRFQVSDSVFRAVSDVESPQGILAIARCPKWTWKDLVALSPAPLLVLDGIQDPGNVAAILRSAEASGAAGIVTTPGTAHLFSPKALRAAMGSTLRLPCLEHLPVQEIATILQKCSYTPVAAIMRETDKKSFLYTQLDWEKPWAILFGAEGKGLSESWDTLVEKFIHIPMQPPVESLNVAVAASVILYESRRQRT